MASETIYESGSLQVSHGHADTGNGVRLHYVEAGPQDGAG